MFCFVFIEISLEIERSDREVWSHVTIVANFLDHNNGELKQRQRRRQRERQKSNTFISAKQQLARTSRIFVHLFLISRARFILGRWAQHNFFSFRIKLRYGPFGFNPRKFRQYLANYMKLNKIDEVWNSAKFAFWVTFPVCCHPEIYTTMATWRNDFSSPCTLFLDQKLLQFWTTHIMYNLCL